MRTRPSRTAPLIIPACCKLTSQISFVLALSALVTLLASSSVASSALSFPSKVPSDE